MKAPKVSIVIPLYNYAEYVSDTVDSCLQQEYEGDVEVIVVDDGSTDRGPDILKLNFRETRLKIIKHKRNKGYSAAKNTGIRESTGDYIALIDADDMLTPGSIAIRAGYLTRNPGTDMVRGMVYCIKDLGGYDYWCKRRYKLRVYGSRKVHAQSTMIRRSVHLRYGLYDEGLRSRSDNEMWNRLDLYAYRGKPLINCDLIEDPPVAFYRSHSRSMVAYRKRNPFYNHQVTTRLQEAIAKRAREGVDMSNTPWLRK